MSNCTTQVNTFTTLVKQLRGIGTNAAAFWKDVETMRTPFATLTRYNAVLKGSLATSEAILNRLRQRNDGDNSGITGMQNDLATSMGGN